MYLTQGWENGSGHNELVFEDDQDMPAFADQSRPTEGPQGQSDSDSDFVSHSRVGAGPSKV